MDNVKQKFLLSHFLQRDHQGFLKNVEVRLIDKTQASNPTKREFYWMRTLRTLCVCVCVRVCVFIFFHREGFFRLQDVQDILEGTDQRSCVVNIS